MGSERVDADDPGRTASPFSQPLDSDSSSIARISSDEYRLIEQNEIIGGMDVDWEYSWTRSAPATGANPLNAINQQGNTEHVTSL